MSPDILLTGSTGFIGSKIQGARPFVGDYSQFRSLYDQMEGCRGVVHMAAVSNRQECEADPKACFQANLIMLTDILEAALRRRIWFLYISTLYLKDRNLYSLSKLMGEELCNLYRAKGLNVNILRLPVVYGPGDRDFKLVTRAINEYRSGRAPKYRNMKRGLYFAYVDDVARHIENIMNVMSFKPPKAYTLTDLDEGIKRCLHADK